MTKVAASATLAVHHEQTFYLSIINECFIRVFQYHRMQFSYQSFYHWRLSIYSYIDLLHVYK